MKRLSRLISTRGGRNPGAGYQRVSPGVYRQVPTGAAPAPVANAVPRPTFTPPNMQAPPAPWQQPPPPPMPQGQPGMGGAPAPQPQQGQSWIKR